MVFILNNGLALRGVEDSRRNATNLEYRWLSISLCTIFAVDADARVERSDDV
jgi:hypothetical protein